MNHFIDTPIAEGKSLGEAFALRTDDNAYFDFVNHAKQRAELLRQEEKSRLYDLWTTAGLDVLRRAWTKLLQGVHWRTVPMRHQPCTQA